MRLTTILQWLLGVMQMHAKDAHLGSDDQLQVWVRPLRVGHRGLSQPHLGFRQRELLAALAAASNARCS